MRKTFAALLPATIVALALACGGDRADPPSATEPASPAAAASPAPAASATPRQAPSVSQARSRWGWKGLSGEFAFFTMSVSPGANPEADRWLFKGGGLSVTAGGFEAECVPMLRVSGWEFSDCRGLAPGEKLHATFTGNAALQLEMTIGSQRFGEPLTRVEERDEPPASANVRLLWHAEAPASYNISSGLWAADGLVFAPHYGGVIEILDAATGNTVGVASVAPASGRGPAAVTEVTVRDGFLYAATTSKGVVVFDVRTPSQPRIAGQYIVDAGANSRQSFTDVHTLFLGPDGITLYAVNQSHATTDLRMIDVSNPASPREIGRYLRPEITQVLDGFHDIQVIRRGSQTVAFLHSLRSGLFILDVSDPRAVTQIGAIKLPETLSHSGAAFESGGKLYYAHNDEGFDMAMTILDVSDLANPTVAGRFQTRRGTSIHNIDIVDGIGYVAYYLDGLRVVDLHDPARPREIGHYDTVPGELESDVFQGAWGVKVMDGRVYVSDMQTGTYAFQVRPGN